MKTKRGENPSDHCFAKTNFFKAIFKVDNKNGERLSSISEQVHVFLNKRIRRQHFTGQLVLLASGLKQ